VSFREGSAVDGTRQRRVNGPARQRWYAPWRLVRLAHHLGFPAREERHGLPEPASRLV